MLRSASEIISLFSSFFCSLGAALGVALVGEGDCLVALEISKGFYYYFRVTGVGFDFGLGKSESESICFDSLGFQAWSDKLLGSSRGCLVSFLSSNF